MPGLVPGIHVLAASRIERRGWPGRGPAMTKVNYLSAAVRLLSHRVVSGERARSAAGDKGGAVSEGDLVVIPGQPAGLNPESRDSGSGPSDHPGMTRNKNSPHRSTRRKPMPSAFFVVRATVADASKRAA